MLPQRVRRVSGYVGLSSPKCSRLPTSTTLASPSSNSKMFSAVLS